ncbi:hypothetical protein VWX96_17050 [Phaeobacter sp. A90a-4f]|uniref:hypothetical protein n=1 Tax=unclassified Phaeobacter TaxID=2621772 RepID=UPI003A83E68E
MKVSTEWRGHAHDLKRIAEMLESRPTRLCSDHVASLHELAEEFEKEADGYETAHERAAHST